MNIRHIAVSVCLLSHAAIAQPTLWQPGFSGSISINAGFGQNQSQQNTHDDNALTTTLNSDGKRTKHATPFILGRLQYNTGNTLIYIGNSEDQITQAQFQAELGVAQRISKSAILTGAVFANLPGMDEVWRDPYLINQDRQTSEQQVAGVRVAADFSTFFPISVKYAYAQNNIQQDEIGASQNLSASQRDMLDRESQYQRFGSEFTFPLHRALIISPALYYTIRNAKGQAHSFNQLSAQLSLTYSHQQHTLITTVRNSSTAFEQENPVFDSKQDQQSMGIFSVYSYAGVFGWRNTQLNIMAGYQTTDSDIDFYNSQDSFVSTGMSYNF